MSMAIVNELSLRARNLAQDTIDLMRLVDRRSESLQAEQYVGLGDLLVQMHRRLVMLCGYFAGLIPVDEGSIQIDSEREYMESAEGFIRTINNLLSA